MATLARPGVEVSQEIAPAAPTIVTPTLNPCMVGPCFAIVEPLLSTGEVDSQAEISTPAILKSTSAVSDPAAVASKLLAFTVDDNDIVVVQLPAVASGSNLPLSMLPESIQSKVPGLKVTLVEDRLVFETDTTGKASRIRLHSKSDLLANSVPGVTGSSEMAYTALNLDTQLDEDFKGKGPYTNTSYVIPYAKLPTYSFHPDGDEMVFEGDNIDIYRLFLGQLTRLSKTGAVNWTKNMSGATSVNGQAVSEGLPTTLLNTPLYAKQGVGSSTNRVFNPGRDASVWIPLSSVFSNLTENWPSASGEYYIYAEAKGAQDFLADQTASVGAYAGVAGNALAIQFSSGAVAVTPGATTNIAYTAATTTFDDLKAAIDSAAAGLSTYFHRFELVYPSANGTDLINPAASTQLAGQTWTLSGGIDPVDFGTDGSVTAAVVAGGMKTDGGTDPVTLLQGKVLTISVDGAEPVEIPMPSGTQTMAQLKTDVEAAVPVTFDIANSIYSKHDSTNPAAVGVKITSDTTLGHDSTIEIGGDPEVIELLFSGFTTKTETLAAGTPTANAVEGTLAQGTDYNLRASTSLEKAVKPLSMSLELSNVLVKAHAISQGGDASMPTAGAYTITLSHSAFTPDGGSQGDPFDISFTTVAQTVADNVSKINTALAGLVAPADGYLVAAAIKLNDASSTEHLVIYDAQNTSGATIRLYDYAAGGSNTTQAWQEAFEGTGSTKVAGFAKDLLTTTATVTVKDDPETNADLPAYLELPFDVSAPANWNWLRDDASVTEVTYATGAIAFYLQEELFYNATTFGRKLTYTRGAANHVELAKPDYTSTVWTGQSSKMVGGDRLYDGGSIVSSVVKTEDLTATGAPSGWGDGATIVLSTEAVENFDTLDSWYVRAENLPTSGGRAIPEIVTNDTTQEVTVKYGLNRGLDGIPLAGEANLYAEYKALRLDVTSEATTPGLLVFDSATEVEEQIGPISTENPLAFALYLGFLNAPTAALSAVGVSETSANSPEGTVLGYQKALELLEQLEVYGLAPLTFNTSVHQLINGHVTAMSEPEQKRERIGLVCQRIPTEKSPTLVASAPDCSISQVSAGVWQLDFGPTVNFTGMLNGKTDANGDTISAGVGATFTASQGIFITRAGDPYRYLVDKQVSATVLQIRTDYAFDQDQGPGTNGNDDSYYYDSDDQLEDFAASGEACTCSVRQAAISLSTSAGKLTAMETLAEIAGGTTGYANRRMVFMQPEFVGTLLDGLETLVPGYYLCAAVSAMIGELAPAQGFTNLPMAGFTRPVGSSDRFTETQMATAAAGGVYWVVQDAVGAPLVSRHQLTTDTTSIKTRELSVTKSVDFVAKQLRTAVKRFIGRFNITPGLINTIALVITGNLKSFVGSVVASADLAGIAVEEDALDEIAIDVDLVPLYPANKIRIRIVV